MHLVPVPSGAFRMSSAFYLYCVCHIQILISILLRVQKPDPANLGKAVGQPFFIHPEQSDLLFQQADFSCGAGDLCLVEVVRGHRDRDGGESSRYRNRTDHLNHSEGLRRSCPSTLFPHEKLTSTNCAF